MKLEYIKHQIIYVFSKTVWIQYIKYVKHNTYLHAYLVVIMDMRKIVQELSNLINNLAEGNVYKPNHTNIISYYFKLEMNNFEEKIYNKLYHYGKQSNSTSIIKIQEPVQEQFFFRRKVYT